MFAATGGGGYGGAGAHRFPKSSMKYKVVQYLRAANGGKSLFRHWHQKFTTDLGQVTNEHEEIVQRMVNEIEFCKDDDIGRRMWR